MTQSNCCNAELHTVTSDEGTAYYMCAQCKNPSDTEQSNPEHKEQE